MKLTHVGDLAGLWDDEVMEEVLQHLINGSRETKGDLLDHIIQSKNVRFINKVQHEYYTA